MIIHVSAEVLTTGLVIPSWNLNSTSSGIDPAVVNKVNKLITDTKCSLIAKTRWNRSTHYLSTQHLTTGFNLTLQSIMFFEEKTTKKRQKVAMIQSKLKHIEWKLSPQ